MRDDSIHQVNEIRDLLNASIRLYNGQSETFTLEYFDQTTTCEFFDIMNEYRGNQSEAWTDLVSILDKTVPLTLTSYAGYSFNCLEVIMKSVNYDSFPFNCRLFSTESTRQAHLRPCAH